MEWDELRSRFDRLFVSQVTDYVSNKQLIDSYQTELLKLYDRWAGANTGISLHGDSV